MFGLGVPELIVIGLIGVLFFGAGKLKNFGRDLGEGIREFKKAHNEEEQMTNVTPPAASKEALPPSETAAKKD